MQLDEIRNRVLIAREERAFLKEQHSQEGRFLLSLSLNIPGYPKSTPLFSEFFDDVLLECKRFLKAHRIAIETPHEVKRIDEAGDFYLVSLPERNAPAFVKSLAEKFEEQHSFGRVIDIDITGSRLQPVSSGKLKRCLLCEKPAIVCMREATHTHQELREYLASGILAYLTEKRRLQTCRQLASLALKAILYEISISPKPGLVSPLEQGAHRDMDYFTFLSSTSAISGYFEEIADSGYAFPDENYSEALPAIRAIGLKMDDAMFSATHGVNTQRGLIFLMGLALFSAAQCIGRDGIFAETACRERIKAICADLVRNELGTDAAAEITHGTACFHRYGFEGAGIRREVEAGLPAVFEQGLPELKSTLAHSGTAPAASEINSALTRALMRLMAVVNDSNILYRKDMEALRIIQRMAQDVLGAEASEIEGKRYRRLLEYCRHEFISPGGSADLLAITIFFYFVNQQFSACAVHKNAD